jgi:hypothetical protein
MYVVHTPYAYCTQGITGQRLRTLIAHWEEAASVAIASVTVLTWRSTKLRQKRGGAIIHHGSCPTFFHSWAAPRQASAKEIQDTFRRLAVLQNRGLKPRLSKGTGRVEGSTILEFNVALEVKTKRARGKKHEKNSATAKRASWWFHFIPKICSAFELKPPTRSNQVQKLLSKCRWPDRSSCPNPCP